MRALKLVQTALKRFYYEHHDKIRLETELAQEIRDERLFEFTQTKHRVIEAIDYRLAKAEKSLSVLREKNGPANAIEDLQSRHDELETLRTFVKGMVTKV